MAAKMAANVPSDAAMAAAAAAALPLTAALAAEAALADGHAKVLFQLGSEYHPSPPW